MTKALKFWESSATNLSQSFLIANAMCIYTHFIHCTGPVILVQIIRVLGFEESASVYMKKQKCIITMTCSTNPLSK